MRAIVFLLSVILLGVSHTVPGAEPVAKGQAVTNEPSVAREQPVTKEQALAAIAVLETNAASDAGFEASDKIVKFAQESTAVSIRLAPDTIPWTNAKLLEREVPVRMLLLAAYIGGNARAQLKTQKAVDDPYQGWLLALDVYRQIRQKRPNIVISEVDALVEKQAKGELKQYAAEIQTKKPKP